MLSDDIPKPYIVPGVKGGYENILNLGDTLTIYYGLSGHLEDPTEYTKRSSGYVYLGHFVELSITYRSEILNNPLLGIMTFEDARLAKAAEVSVIVAIIVVIAASAAIAGVALTAKGTATQLSLMAAA